MDTLLIPALSRPFFGTIDLDETLPLTTAKAFFDAFDRAGNKDPTNCKFLEGLTLDQPQVKCVLSCTKLAIDADGRAVDASFKDGEELDPDSGQNQTSLKFSDGTELDSEGCPYFVLPGGTYPELSGLKLGDVCIVILEDVLTAAVLGDTGPGTGPPQHTRPKLGEGSIRLHKRLRPAAPDPCVRHDDQGRCTLIRNASIDGGVLCIAFLDSAIPDLLEETAQAQIEAKAFALWTSIGGVLPAEPSSSASA